MEVGTEFSWQDMPLYRFEEIGWLIPPWLSYYPDTNSAFSRNMLNKIGNKMAIWYVNIRNTLENKTSFYFYNSFDATSFNGGWGRKENSDGNGVKNITGKMWHFAD
jgi:hypothetical protein